MSQITLAHEIGHNLGSPHDPEGRCSPGGSDGNFIMYPSATSGYRKNNPRFSPCSLASMSAAVDAVPNLFSECLKVRNMFLYPFWKREDSRMRSTKFQREVA